MCKTQDSNGLKVFFQNQMKLGFE